MPAERRVFTFEEARRLLPEVREWTRRAMEAIAELPAGGEARRAGQGILERWARDIQEMGIEVKGPWLVDFDSGAGYWCWRWPEESLDFFHGYEEGFAGRVRIQ